MSSDNISWVVSNHRSYERWIVCWWSPELMLQLHVFSCSLFY